MIRCRTQSIIEAFRGAFPAKVDAPLLQRLPLIGHRWFSADSDAETREITNPRVLELADAITQLNMLEVSDLTEVLRRRLNLQMPSFGVPMGMAAPMMPGGMPASGAAAGQLLSLPCLMELLFFSPILTRPSLHDQQTPPLKPRPLKKRRSLMSS